MTTETNATLDDVQATLLQLKAEGASVDDPRVKIAIAEFGRLMTAERLARRMESAMATAEHWYTK